MAGEDLQLLTPDEVCALLKFDQAALVRLLSSGRFPLGVEVEAGDMRWPRGVVADWIAGLYEEARQRQVLTDANTNLN